MDNSLGHDDVPEKRSGFVRPSKNKLSFDDGNPKPAKRLQGFIQKVISELYQFTPIPQGQDFRLLQLFPGRGTETVRCSLVPSILHSSESDSRGRARSYEALSYFWGKDDPSIPITITSYNPSGPRHSFNNYEHKKFFIRPNLHAALLELRGDERVVWLWVDAICINQEDMIEKNAQVSRMNEIYSEAFSICIWLGIGDSNADTKQTFDFIRQILDLKFLDRLVVDRSYATGWLAFVKIMRNRWFSRRWVVQELALAKQATIHWGEQNMQWSDFANAVALFVTKHDQINKLLKDQNPAVSDPIGDMKALGANTLVEATSNMFRRSKDGVISEKLLSLEILVSTLLAFEATNPRDIIYAVLSIAKDTPYSNKQEAAQAASPTRRISAPGADFRIIPNYKKSLPEVCVDFIHYCVDTSKSLDIICRHWAPSSDTEESPSTSETTLAMPTWVTSIDGSAFGGAESALQGRRGGDSLVGVPSRQNRRNYSASGDLKPSIRIERGSSTPPRPATTQHETSSTSNEHSKKLNLATKTDIESPLVLERDQPQNGNTGKVSVGEDMPKAKVQSPIARLFAKGICLDVIGKLSPRNADGLIMQESLEMGGLAHPIEDMENVPDILWRTLVADRGPDNTNAPSWYHLACLQCLMHVTPNGDLSTGALKAHPETATTMVTFLKRVQQVVWNRKFLLSKEDRLFGLAPTNALEGDLICILFGCSVPVILRKVEEAGGFYYDFVGESYIYGMMDGEALVKLSEEQREEPYPDQEEFEIR